MVNRFTKQFLKDLSKKIYSEEEMANIDYIVHCWAKHKIKASLQMINMGVEIMCCSDHMD